VSRQSRATCTFCANFGDLEELSGGAADIEHRGDPFEGSAACSEDFNAAAAYRLVDAASAC
jgi:hypothetical protein